MEAHFVGARLDGDLRAVREGGVLVFDRIFDKVVPQTEARRLEFYLKWRDTASPGDLPPLEDFGVAGAVASDTFSFDPDLNFDRLLIKVRIPKSAATTDDALILAVSVDNHITKTLDLALVPDPNDDGFLLTEKPVLLYDDPNAEVDTAAVEAVLPENAVLLDPPAVANAITAYIGSTTNPPACDAVAANYAIHAVSPLFSHVPTSNPQTFTQVASGVINTPGTGANWRLTYQTNTPDTTPDVRVTAVDPSGNLPAPLEVRWFLNVKFKCGDTSWGSGRVWNVPAQWHLLPDDLALNLAEHLVALVSDQAVDALGPADYEILAQVVHPLTGQQKLVLESNLVPFKIVGINPGQNAITGFVDQLTIEPGGPVTSAMANRLQPDMRKWMKSVAKHESAAGSWTGRQDWDQFERNPESAGIDQGFQRSVLFQGQTLMWKARFGWPFVSYDNGYGIMQLTVPPPAYRNVSRWKNTVYAGWRILTIDKLRAAVTYLQQIAGRALTAADDPVLLRETVKRYNGGHQYVFDSQNGVFVKSPNQNVNYVDQVEAAGTQAGFLP